MPAAAPALRRRARRGWAVALTALVVVSVAFGSAGSGRADAAPASDQKARRVLLFSVPGLSWAEVEDAEMPALERFFADAAVADMAPRSVLFSATPGDAYLTIASGTRSIGEQYFDGLQLGVDEPYGEALAGEVFSRRTGEEANGPFVALAWPTLRKVNDREPYDAVLGLLATTLHDNDVATGVVANAGGLETGVPSFERQAGLAMADTRGVINGGALGDDLLVHDSRAAFGVMLDPAAVATSFEAQWTARGAAGDDDSRAVVLVEASDLARTLRYRSTIASDRLTAMRTKALADTDKLFRRLMRQVDLDRDTVVVVGPYLGRDRGLTVAAMRGPGVATGYLRSASTQRSGVVTLVDVAPTILDTMGIARPAGMEGRPFESVASDRSFDGRREQLVAINDASRFREQLLVPTTLVLVLLLAGVAAAAVVMIAGRRSAAARRRVAFAALLVMAGLPSSYLARAFPLEDLGPLFYWPFLVVASLVFAFAAWRVGRRTGNPLHGLWVVLALVLLVPIVDVMTGSNLHLSSAFGYSPTGNSRLYGISNYSFGQLASASCLLAALIAFTFPSRPGRLAALGLLTGVLVVLGVPIWGSDVGGVLAFTPTILAFAALVFRFRIRIWSAVAAMVITAATVTVFGLIDLARPEGQRAHLGRLFERIGNEGLEPLISIVSRKLAANVRVSTSSLWVAAIPIAFLFWLFLRRWTGRPLARVHARLPTLHPALLATVVAAVLGSLLNDSGAIVGGVAVLVMTASLAFLAMEVEPQPRPSRVAAARSAPPVAVDEKRDEPVPTRVRWFVRVLLAMLLVPGIIGFEFWPMSGWRLFSLSRDSSETRWEIDAVADDERVTTLQLDKMALGYRHSQWLLAELPDANDSRREEVCRALLKGARLDVPSAVKLRVIRDKQRMVQQRGEWTVVHNREVLHECGPRDNR